MLSALEVVLPEKDLKLKSNIVSKPDLRRASIHLLISMLTLPLHFQVNIYIILLLQNLLLFNKLSFCNLTWYKCDHIVEEVCIRIFLIAESHHQRASDIPRHKFFREKSRYICTVKIEAHESAHKCFTSGNWSSEYAYAVRYVNKIESLLSIEIAYDLTLAFAICIFGWILQVIYDDNGDQTFYFFDEINFLWN